jgi:hypothetical protein
MFAAHTTGPRGKGHLLTLAAGLVVLLPASPSHARTRYTPVESVRSIAQGPLEVSVRVAGSTATLFQPVDRADRWYLQAKKGGNYEVRVRNTTGERIAFVIAVDGINAINGTRSHLGADEPMYVLDPWQTTTVKGWRKDLGNVSRFVFVDEERSYAARTDRANGDLGWIRVAAFNEFRPVAWGSPKTKYREDGGARERAAAPEAKDAPQRGEMSKNGVGSDSYEPPAAAPSPGTGWGGNQKDRVHEVDFTPERFACTQVVLRYEYERGLVALGIFPRRAPNDRLWEREHGTLGFAQPPTR